MGRDRTSSNENFTLPPLPADEDNADFKEQKMTSLLNNYASNSKIEQEVPTLQDLSAIVNVDDEQETSKELTSLADEFKLDDDDIEEVRNPLADDSSPQFLSNVNMDIAVKSQGPLSHKADNNDLENVLGIESTMARIDKTSDDMKSFDAFLLKQDTSAVSQTLEGMKSALEPLSPVVTHNKTEDSLELVDEHQEEQQAKKAEIADIFDQVDQFDNFYNLKDDV